ncbi:MAG: tRNA pseudouridine(55) synthase TruB [Oscillospiraceae bacterium]
MTGIICLYKPKGITSFSAVNKLRKIIGEKKAGHTGTLDPMATGVLPIVFSHATRFIELLPTHKKEYKAKIMLGITTDTLDITGEVIKKQEVNVTKEEILKAVNSFMGEIEQTPPMYSAIKKGGIRLYELARKGEEIERESRKITIFSIKAYDFSAEEFTLEVECSAGTYIRSLADDIGKILGCGAVLTELERTSANGFKLEDCYTFEEISALYESGEIIKAFKNVDNCLDWYDKINVTDKQSVRFKNGGGLMLSRIENPKEVGYYRVYSHKDEFLGIGEIKQGSEELSVKRVFVGDEN